jgi:nucleoside phosphorylase
MSTSRPTLSYDDYTVGIICATVFVLQAVRRTLDEEHSSSTRAQKTTGEDNGHLFGLFGRIGAHNVVVAVIGHTAPSAATIANLMMRNFPIRIGLMVGIGSGVWSEQTDTRLGDLVVSGSNREHGGVVQFEYDSHGEFQKTGTLNKPPRSVLDAIRSRELDASFGAMEFRCRNLSHEDDELFEANYEHVGGDECANCDRSRLVRNRPNRTDDGRPRVHYGTIASSNVVLEDGLTRDRIARDEGIICFETDAAGLMPTFPCVVIRGICDYADSHMSFLWDFRAATVAAAYAKMLLQSIPAADLAAERLASEVCGRYM